MRKFFGVLLRTVGIVAIGYAEVVTLVWVYNEHGLGWTVAALLFLPSALVLSFIAEFSFGVILLAGLAASMYGNFLSKGYWETDEDHRQKVEAEIWRSQVQTNHPHKKGLHHEE